MYGKVNIMTNEHKPIVEQKELLQPVEVGVRGSELYVVGNLDPQTKIIKNAKIEHRPGSMVTMGPDASPEKSDSKAVWSVESESDFWQIHLGGLDGSTCESVDVKRSDGKQWSYALTNGEGPSYPSTDLVFSQVHGYLAPIFRANRNKVDMQGRRLIAVEPLNDAAYVGTVEPAFKVDNDGIKIITQPTKHTSPDLIGVSTTRAVRASVHKPDYDNLQPIPGTITRRLEQVDLHPDLIASAPSGEKMRVNIIGLEYDSNAAIPENQTMTPLKEYADTSADGVGFAGFYQLFTEKFADHLGVNEEGINMEKADYQYDSNESYGKPIRVALIKGDRVWKVVYEDDPNGKFDRDGNPIPTRVARNFDPTKSKATPLQVHKFRPVNINNMRETGTNGSDGLHPVEVYVYGQDENTKKFKSETLCDFEKSGDGPAQMALFAWEVHTYGNVFNKVAIKQHISSIAR